MVIEVEDDGPGFPAERGRLLEPYVTTRGGGTGLGLAIVSKIMEEHTGPWSCSPASVAAPRAARLPDRRA